MKAFSCLPGIDGVTDIGWPADPWEEEEDKKEPEEGSE